LFTGSSDSHEYCVLFLKAGIDNDELGEELGPNDGRDLHGSVAKRLDHLEAGGQVSPANNRPNTQTDFIPTGSNVEVDTSGYVMA
jgi:hypothetical protein